MSRNGSGTYSLPAGNPVVTGTTISSTWANNTLSDVATALTASIASDGQTTPSASLPMGGFRHTNVANSNARTNYASAADVQDSTLVYLTSVSGTDTITATAANLMSAYATGQRFHFLPAGANTGAVTININSIGAKSITKAGTTALVAGDIPASSVVTIIYDGTRFQLAGVNLNVSAYIQTLLDDASASAARTTLGLGTISTQDSNNVSITGGSATGITATITGGSITGITDLAVADGGTGASDASTARTNLGLGTISTQAASNVSITGGSITGITDLAVADGGTGASTASAALSNLGALPLTGGTISGSLTVTNNSPNSLVTNGTSSNSIGGNITNSEAGSGNWSYGVSGSGGPTTNGAFFIFDNVSGLRLRIPKGSGAVTIPTEVGTVALRDVANTFSAAQTFSDNVNFTGDFDLNSVEGNAGQVMATNTTSTGMVWWAPRGWIAGLTLSNGTDANNDIDIAVGECTDSTNAYVLKLTSVLTKQLDAAWAAGTNAGGLDTGSEASSTWYHIWLIRKDSDGSIDALFSTSASSPTMPAGYTAKRRIGSVRNNGSSNLLGFYQLGDRFLLKVPASDISATNPGTSAVLRTLTVPSGIVVVALGYSWTKINATLVDTFLSSPNITDTAPDGAGTGVYTNVVSAATANDLITSGFSIETNTSSQIRSRLGFSDASTILNINTHGWVDYRGRAD